MPRIVKKWTRNLGQTEYIFLYILKIVIRNIGFANHRTIGNQLTEHKNECLHYFHIIRGDPLKTQTTSLTDKFVIYFNP